jgi:hypothetical protein
VRVSQSSNGSVPLSVVSSCDGKIADRDPDTFAIPTIANGTDIQALIGVIMEQVRTQGTEDVSRPAAINIDSAKLNQRLSEG